MERQWATMHTVSAGSVDSAGCTMEVPTTQVYLLLVGDES